MKKKNALPMFSWLKELSSHVVPLYLLSNPSTSSFEGRSSLRSDFFWWRLVNAEQPKLWDDGEVLRMECEFEVWDGRCLLSLYYETNGHVWIGLLK